MNEISYSRPQLAKYFGYEPVPKDTMETNGYWAEMFKLALALPIGTPNRFLLIAAVSYYFDSDEVPYSKEELASYFSCRPVPERDAEKAGYWTKMLQLAQALPLKTENRNKLISAVIHYFNNSIENTPAEDLKPILT